MAKSKQKDSGASNMKKEDVKVFFQEYSKIKGQIKFFFGDSCFK